MNESIEFLPLTVEREQYLRNQQSQFPDHNTVCNQNAFL